MTLMMLDAYTNAAVASSVGVAVVFSGGFGFCLSCALVLVFFSGTRGRCQTDSTCTCEPGYAGAHSKTQPLHFSGENFKFMIGSRFSLRTSRAVKATNTNTEQHAPRANPNMDAYRHTGNCELFGRFVVRLSFFCFFVEGFGVCKRPWISVPRNFVVNLE